MKRVLGYTFFLPVFLISSVICNIILRPILEFIDKIFSFISFEPPSFLWEHITEPAMIGGICVYASLKASLWVYPGNNELVPIVVCISSLLVLNIFQIFIFNEAYNLITELNPNESLDDISKPRIYVYFISNVVGYLFAYYLIKKESY